MKTKAQREYEEQQLADYKHIAKHWPIVLLSVVVIWVLVVAYLIII